MVKEMFVFFALTHVLNTRITCLYATLGSGSITTMISRGRRRRFWSRSGNPETITRFAGDLRTSFGTYNPDTLETDIVQNCDGQATEVTSGETLDYLTSLLSYK